MNHQPNHVQKKQNNREQIAICGVHPVRVVLRQTRVSEVWIRYGANETRLIEVTTEAKATGIRIIQVSTQEFDRAVSPGINHQGVIAFAKPREMEPENALPLILDGHSCPLVLVLDGVTDPHNLGACLRSAEAFGVNCVIVPKDNSAPLNQIVRKTSSGASELIPVVKVTNLARCLRALQKEGFWIIGAAGEATMSIEKVPHEGPVGLVMGSEGSGLRRLTREICDALVAIPLLGFIESLNVSVATGVLLYDLQSRRGALKSSRIHGDRM